MTMRTIRLTAAILMFAAPAMAQVSTSAGSGTGSGAGRGTGNGWLGIGLGCESCTIARVSRTGPEWRFPRGYPAISWLDADGPAYQGGLRAGDTLTKIDGIDLLTGDGGRALAQISSGQRIELTYRREGRERRAQITVGMRVESAANTLLSGNLERARAQADSIQRMSRLRSQEIQQAQRQIEQAQRELERLSRELTRAEGSRLDSTRRRMASAESSLASAMARAGYQTPPRTPTPTSSRKYLPGTTPPSPPVIVNVPAPMIAPTAPTPRATPYVYSYTTRDASRSLTSEDFSTFGRLRYSKRMGDMVITARAPGAVNTVEEGDSVLIITSGDMSVRVSLRSRGTPAADPDSAEATPAPAPVPAPAARPRPARPATTPSPAPAPRRP